MFKTIGSWYLSVYRLAHIRVFVLLFESSGFQLMS